MSLLSISKFHVEFCTNLYLQGHRQGIWSMGLEYGEDRGDDDAHVVQASLPHHRDPIPRVDLVSQVPRLKDISRFGN